MLDRAGTDSTPRASNGKKISWKTEKRVIARPCVLSCPTMVSVRTVCRHCLANAQVCPFGCGMGRPYGGNHGQASE
jgi:hypothetical protein